MKCYHHPDRDAVAYCSQCGRGLCAECSDAHNPIMCDNCAQLAVQQLVDDYNEIIRKNKQKIRTIHIIIIVTTILVTLGFWGIARSPIAALLTGVPTGIFVGWEIAGIPYGWRALNNLFSNLRFILILPIIGWLIFYGIKLGLAAVIGIVAMPIEYFKMRKVINQNQA
ncbi:MAG: hypothetical protein IJ784_09985 [Ruminiclostridium sp.]|nr:hypothetical protein [Ruminiclostridium sp.]